MVPAAGIVAGTVYDLANSLILSKPCGYLCAVDQMIHQPSPENVIDTAAMLAGDAFTSYSGALMGAKVGHHVGPPSKPRPSLPHTLNEGAHLVVEHSLMDANGSAAHELENFVVYLAEKEAFVWVERKLFNAIEHKLEHWWLDPDSRHVILSDARIMEHFLLLTAFQAVDVWYFDK